jgi:hypothetical protein
VFNLQLTLPMNSSVSMSPAVNRSAWNRSAQSYTGMPRCAPTRRKASLFFGVLDFPRSRVPCYTTGATIVLTQDHLNKFIQTHRAPLITVTRPADLNPRTRHLYYS